MIATKFSTSKKTAQTLMCAQLTEEKPNSSILIKKLSSIQWIWIKQHFFHVPSLLSEKVPYNQRVEQGRVRDSDFIQVYQYR